MPYLTHAHINWTEGMTFVVSFSSCLDVAAISMDMGQALDTNNELMTVGISNCKFFLMTSLCTSSSIFTKCAFLVVVSGLLGGFTGSYIFSQTLFTYRTGCRSRWIGILVGLSFVAGKIFGHARHSELTTMCLDTYFVFYQLSYLK